MSRFIPSKRLKRDEVVVFSSLLRLFVPLWPPENDTDMTVKLALDDREVMADDSEMAPRERCVRSPSSSVDHVLTPHILASMSR